MPTPKFRPPKLPSLQSWRAHLLAALDHATHHLHHHHHHHHHQILSQSVTSGLWRLDPFLSSRIISSLCNNPDSLPLARLAFDSIPKPSPFAFNSLIRAHSHSSPGPGPISSLFRRMLRSSLYPDRFTFPFLLRSFPYSAPALHSLALRHGLSPRDAHVATSLLHSYASSGLLGSARLMFDEMPKRTVVTWNALISCFARQEWLRQEEGLFLFGEMVCCSPCDGVRPNVDTFIGALSCCAGLGALDHGRSVHVLAMRWLDGCVSAELGTALVHMYCKCGSLGSGKKVFEMMENKDVSTWTAMIGGLAMHGCGEEAVGMFERMVEEKLTPDSLVFTSVLHACSHSGLVEKGIKIFNDMKEEYKVNVRMEHYGAMVDLFGRAGRLEEAEEMVKSMPYPPNRVVFGSLLHACLVNGEVEFGKRLERQLLESGLGLEEEGDGSGFYVGVSNVYAKNGRWDEVRRVRSRMMENGVRKESGFSLVEVNGSVRKFSVVGARHSLTGKLHSLLCGINKEMAYA